MFRIMLVLTRGARIVGGAFLSKTWRKVDASKESWRVHIPCSSINHSKHN